MTQVSKDGEWVLLTSNSGYDELWVRFSSIVAMARTGAGESGAYTQLMLAGSTPVGVEESPSDIFQAYMAPAGG